ncbi:unnamed protein product [Cuscuta epithymum]|uniref:Uncharacterized protein n=1 Tax=Cuscuta epithymum TaxID=186058 RepID=A0AAV0G9V8_9ASTE|nr:unnamed protein product [Cuscuta epithymum]
MESDDDFESFSPCEEPSLVLKNPSFKRLKKPGVALKDPHVSSTDDTFLFPDVDFAKLEALEASKSLEDESDDSEEPLSSDKSHGNECELEPENRKDSRRALSFHEDNGLDMNPNPGLRSVGECEQIEEDLEPPAVEFLSKTGDGSEGTMEGIENHKPKETENKRSNADLNSNGNDKSKSKKAKHNVDDAAESKPKEPASNKRRERKERKQNLQQIHVETQRILREKRDASFKPIPIVHKPISSVLEKIRQRKLEISKKNITLSNTVSSHTINGHMRELMDEDDVDNTYKDDIIVIRSEKKTKEKTGSHVEDLKDDATGPADSEVNENCESVPSQPFRDIVLDEVAKPMFRAPVDTQDLFGDSQDRDEINEIPECKEDSNRLEEVMAPSVLAMNLKFDSLPPDECSSDEDNDTDDVDQDAKLDAPSPRGDPVKAFLDEEAEEEDDSDNDLHRFSENEDDEDFEAVKDIIATNYEEKPSDNERRNELHRKWLEQQDAAGTENLLQKLKFGSDHREPTLLDEEQVDSEGEDFNEDAGEHTKSTRVNKRKAKQIITQMFMEKDDVFLSDDDEEKDKMIVKQRVLIRAEEKTTLVSPIEDEDSKTLFGLIKKHNVVPDKRKKAKPPSFFDKILGGPKDNSLSKSSFLGRTSKHHIPVPHKQSSSLVRSFIFERDDSNSRNSISMSDDSSDMVIKENNPTRSNAPRFSNSQAKFNTQSKSSVAQTSSGASLFEILKQSSSPLSSFGDQGHGIDFTRALHAAFRVPKKPAKFGTAL